MFVIGAQAAARGGADGLHVHFSLDPLKRHVFFRSTPPWFCAWCAVLWGGKRSLADASGWKTPSYFLGCRNEPIWPRDTKKTWWFMAVVCRHRASHVRCMLLHSMLVHLWLKGGGSTPLSGSISSVFGLWLSYSVSVLGNWKFLTGLDESERPVVTHTMHPL